MYKSCNNCGRFPFCDYQMKCSFCNYKILDEQNQDYWIKRNTKLEENIQ